MSCPSKVAEWTPVIHTHLPHMSKPPGAVLALGSLGMVAGTVLPVDRRQRVAGRAASAQGALRPGSTCASGVTRPRLSGAPTGRRSRWRRALCPCCSGYC